MAYTTIDNPELYFQTKLYTGNGGTQSITLDGSENMQPDWVWIKKRNGSADHSIMDSVRGVRKSLRSNSVAAEYTESSGFSSFDSNGFSFDGTAYNHVNRNGDTFVSWNWLAGGTAPAITYTVKVVSDSGNKYRFNDYGTSAVTLDLQEGGTYTFDLSDSSNDGHPMKFSETSNGSHGGGSTYSTGIVYQLDGASVTESNYVSNFNSASSRKIIITVAASAPTLYYFCHYHSGMGGQVNTNSTFGSSNFSGSIQSTVSAGTTQGFSIVSYTGTGSLATIGHSLGSAPAWLIFKKRSEARDWMVYHHKNTSAPETDFLLLNSADATVDNDNFMNDTAPTSSVFTVKGFNEVNKSSQTYICYAFTEKKGYSKFGSYIGGGSSFPFIYTGFKPAMVIFKNTSTSNRQWQLLDNKRSSSGGNNVINITISPNNSNDESWWGTNNYADFLSNGFKLRSSYDGVNESSGNYIYMAFAESPFVNSNGVPTNAR